MYFIQLQRIRSRLPISLPEILTTHDLVICVSEGHLSIKNSHAESIFLVLLGSAWMGGLILNLMPCVFPVIGLKILGFVRQGWRRPGLDFRVMGGYLQSE